MTIEEMKHKIGLTDCVARDDVIKDMLNVMADLASEVGWLQTQVKKLEAQRND